MYWRKNGALNYLFTVEFFHYLFLAITTCFSVAFYGLVNIDTKNSGQQNGFY